MPIIIPTNIPKPGEKAQVNRVSKNNPTIIAERAPPSNPNLFHKQDSHVYYLSYHPIEAFGSSISSYRP